MTSIRPLTCTCDHGHHCDLHNHPLPRTAHETWQHIRTAAYLLSCLADPRGWRNPYRGRRS